MDNPASRWITSTIKRLQQAFSGEPPQNKKLSANPNTVASAHVSRALTRNLREKIDKCFGASLTQSADWRHEDVDFDRVRGDFYKIWSTHKGGHKKYSYFRQYERMFGEYRNKKAMLLEIGVYKGATLKTWPEYLGAGSTVVGIDNNPDCMQHHSPSDGRYVCIGDQSDATFLNSVGKEFGPFDLIIDDGSHITEHQIDSFNTLFVDYLAPGGVYFIEDTNTSLWPQYRSGKLDILDLVEAAAAATHVFYGEHNYRDYRRSEHPKTFTVCNATKLIEEIRVIDSGVAIFKGGAQHFPPLVDHRH